MADPVSSTHSEVIPCLRYRDANAAIAWLCEIFGFERQLVVPGENGTVLHAQLTLGHGMVMLGSAVDSVFGRLMKLPEEIGGAGTQSTCVTVADADLIYTRAKEAGATIELEIKDEPYGGRGFTCRDPEGHTWTIGTYDPWK